MKIDLTALKKEKKDQVDLNFLLNLDTIDYYGDQINVPSPVSVTGKLYVMDKRIYLNCNVKADLLVDCSRCLEPFTYQLDEKINAELVQEDSNEENQDDEDDLIFYQDEVIELDEIIKESIFINVPLKTLCSDNCKGLCVQCGKNLNVHECQCSIEEEQEEEVLDPRLAKLKELLQED
ncbi:YceD family protein [Alkaliphilus transvaalensis]|uniref:YceD family protein n=1 Tax=Alkaliphilus transvaalensis TaxID=114628 RepID=UPI00047AD190|nr:YceD family protein [Alkaliphilus transvaalensis]